VVHTNISRFIIDNTYVNNIVSCMYMTTCIHTYIISFAPEQYFSTVSTGPKNDSPRYYEFYGGKYVADLWATIIRA